MRTTESRVKPQRMIGYSCWLCWANGPIQLPIFSLNPSFGHDARRDSFGNLATWTAAGPKNVQKLFQHSRAIQTIWHTRNCPNLYQIGHFMDNYSTWMLMGQPWNSQGTSVHWLYCRPTMPVCTRTTLHSSRRRPCTLSYLMFTKQSLMAAFGPCPSLWP